MFRKERLKRSFVFFIVFTLVFSMSLAGVLADEENLGESSSPVPAALPKAGDETVAALTITTPDATPNWTGRPQLVYVNLTVSETTISLAGSTVKITVPDVFMEPTPSSGYGLRGVSFTGTTSAIGAEGGNRTLTYTFTDLSPGNYAIPIYVTTRQLLTPDGFQVPVNATFTTPTDQEFASQPLVLSYKTQKPRTLAAIAENYAYTVNDGVSFYGGPVDPAKPGFIHPTDARYLDFSFQTRSVSTGELNPNYGARTFEKRIVEVTLPQYAVFNGDVNPGWTYNESTKVATFVHTSDSTYPYNTQPVSETAVRLKLKFPGAPVNTLLTQQVKVTYVAKNETPYEAANRTVNLDNQKFVLNTTAPVPTVIKAPTPSTITDQMTSKQKDIVWITTFTNKASNMKMENIVVRDHSLDPRMEYTGVTIRTTYFSGDRTMNVYAKVDGEWILVQENVSVPNQSTPLIPIPVTATEVKVETTPGSLLGENGMIYFTVITRLKDPVNTTYDPLNQYLPNSAEGSGNYEGMPSTAASFNTTGLLKMLPYHPQAYISKYAAWDSVPKPLLEGETANYTLMLNIPAANRLLTPDALVRPAIVDILPAGMAYDETQIPLQKNTSGNAANNSLFPERPEIVENYQGTGQTALIWKATRDFVPGTPTSDTVYSISYQGKATYEMEPGANKNKVYFGWQNNQGGTPVQHVSVVPNKGTADIYGIGGGGQVAYAELDVAYAPSMSLIPYQRVQGELDALPKSAGHTEAGGTGTYFLNEFNAHTQIPVDRLTMLNILPRKGVDGSAYDVYLDGAVTGPAGYDIQYSTVEPGASLIDYVRTGSNWSSALPIDKSTVRGIRITMKAGTTIPPNTKVTFQVPFQVPYAEDLEDGMAAYSNLYNDTGGVDLVKAPETLLRLQMYGVSGHSFVDLNRNGIREAADQPLAGVTVKLLDEQGNPVKDGAGEDITAVTDDAGYYILRSPHPGKFKVAATMPNGYQATLMGVNAAADENANHINGAGESDLFQPQDHAYRMVTRNVGFYYSEGSLIVTKALEDKAGNPMVKQKEFTFLLTVDGQPYEGKININGTDIDSVDGKFTMKNGDEVKVEGLPIDSDYTIAEQNTDGYLTTPEDGSISGIIADDEQTAAFTNRVAEDVDDVIAEKIWEGVPEGENVPTIWFKLYRSIEGGEPQEVADAQIQKLEPGTTQVTWADMDVTDEEGERWQYSVKEVNENGEDFVPANYEKEETDLKVTNRHTPAVVPTPDPSDPKSAAPGPGMVRPKPAQTGDRALDALACMGILISLLLLISYRESWRRN